MSNIKRYSLLGGLLLLSAGMLRPAIQEIDTILLIILIECVAIVLSLVASYGFTKIDFTEEFATNNLGYIFMGVHICVGFTVLGVYIVQYS